MGAKQRAAIRTAIVTAVTFTLFMFEAMFHYNIGKNGGRDADGELDVHLPSWRELLTIAAIVFAFSVANGAITALLLKYVLNGASPSS